MQKYEILIFNKKQLNLVKIFLRLHLIQPISAGKLYHPITNKQEAFEQVYNTYPFVEFIMSWVYFRLFDKNGREAMRRLENCGVIASD